MANWAIVVGVDKYWRPEFELKSCLKDAVKMAQWLLTSESCKVLPQNLYLMTRPTPPPPASGPLPGGVNRLDASFDSLVDATQRLVARSGGKGDKFFFYFSGHGLTNASAIDPEEAIVLADFDATHTDNALELRSFIEFFKSTRFDEQFFIVDACRNVLDWGKKFRTREFTLVGDIDPNLPPVQQYTLLATSPRRSAVAIGDKSAFTEEFLNGLSGRQMTVTLDTAANEYVVTTSRLFRFVEKQIEDRKINVSDDPNKPFFQKPRINGEHGSNDPELARLTAAEVEKVNLRVFVDPNSAWQQAEITIRDQFGDDKHKISPINTLPESLALEPMFYTARASAPGYEPAQPKWPIDLYVDRDVPVTLIPIPRDPTPGKAVLDGDVSIDSIDAQDLLRAEQDIGRGEGLLSAGEDTRPKALGGGLFGGLVTAKRPTEIFVTTSDRLARLELMDVQGIVVAKGLGQISKKIEPGFYRAHLITPEGQVVEKLVSVDDGEQEKVSLEAPEPTSQLLKEFTDRNLLVAEDNTLDIANDVGPIASPQLSTVLALTGSMVNQDEQLGQRLRSLGVRSFQESVPPGTTSGLQLLSGSDGPLGVSSELTRMKFRLWPIDQTDGPGFNELTSSETGLYQFSQAVEPGHYWFSLAAGELEPVDFALAVLPLRLSMVVFQYDAGGSLRVYQYSLSLTREPDKHLDQEQVRRLELTQRFYMSGRLDYALETARDLLYAKWVDPLAGCLGCYLLLGLNKANELPVAVTNMVRYYDELCDSHVLKGEYEASAGRPETARKYFLRALDLGVPVFADGLTRLFGAVQKYQLQDHPRAKLISRMAAKRVRGFLWTCWKPAKEIRSVESINTVVNVGGDYIDGDKMTAGGDINKAEGDINIAHRDVIKVAGNLFQSQQPAGGNSLPGIFSQLLEASRSAPDADVEVVEGVIDKLKEIALRVQQGDESLDASRLLAVRLKSLINVQRDVGQLALERLSDPEAQVSSRIRQVAREVQAAGLDG